MDHPDFLPLVKEVWNNENIHGRKLFIFKEKLKFLKSKLKSWNTEVFDKLNLQVKKAINGMNQLDSILINDVNTMSYDFLEHRREVKSLVWEKLQI